MQNPQKSTYWRSKIGPRGVVFSLVGLALFLYGLLLVMGVEGTPVTSHDSIISYLAATGHQGEYERSRSGELSGRFVKASEWKRLWRIEDRFCFSRIAEDLAHNDRHPPLYFWLLHLAFLAAGASAWAGMALHLVVGWLVVIAVFLFVRFLLEDDRYAALACVLWAVSPGVLTTSVESRQYLILSLWVLLFIWQTLRIAESQSGWKLCQAVLLVLTMWLGLMTHYQFVLIMSGGVGWLSLRFFRRRDFQGLGITAGLVMGAIVLLWLTHPQFYLSLRSIPASADGPGFLVRLSALAEGSLHFFCLDKAYTRWLKWLLVPLLFLAGWALTRARRKSQPGSASQPRLGGMWFFLLWVFLSMAGPYLAALTPAHAVGLRYFAPLYPLMAGLIALGISRLPRLRLPVAIAAVGLMAVVSAFSVRMFFQLAPVKMILEVRQAGAIVSLSTRRGFFPRTIFHARDDAIVFAAEKEELSPGHQQILTRLPPGTLLALPWTGQPQIEGRVRVFGSEFVFIDCPPYGDLVYKKGD